MRAEMDATQADWIGRNLEHWFGRGPFFVSGPLSGLVKDALLVRGLRVSDAPVQGGAAVVLGFDQAGPAVLDGFVDAGVAHVLVAANAADGGAETRRVIEQAAIEVGLRKHAKHIQTAPYDTMDAGGPLVLCAFEGIPSDIRSEFPLTRLAVERDLHMDMTREAGRRSDAHLARYAEAARLVQHGDVILDAACGYGYGSHMLATTTGAAQVIGLDLSPDSVEYARKNFGRTNVEFHVADVTAMTLLANASVDLVVSFETLEHIPNPNDFLDEIGRVLRPGGRVIVSVPNDWSDETGEDPSPYHHQVYDWERLASELRSRFLLDRGFAQTCGGGRRLPHAGRRMVAFGTGGPVADSEWILAVAMKPPEEAAPQESEDPQAPANLMSFRRDYAEPALVRAMVTPQSRLQDRLALRNLAKAALLRHRPGTVDHAAALCVRAYQELGLEPNADGHARLLDEISAAIDPLPLEGHGLRWRVSLAYVAGLIASRTDRRSEALAWFERCRDTNPFGFSPTLATKTVTSAYRAGCLLQDEGRTEDAISSFAKGVDVLFAAFALPRERWIGAGDTPFWLPEVEMAEMTLAGSNCIGAMRALKAGRPLPSFVGENLQVRIVDLERRLHDAERVLITATDPKERAAAALGRSILRMAGRFGLRDAHIWRAGRLAKRFFRPAAVAATFVVAAAATIVAPVGGKQ